MVLEEWTSEVSPAAGARVLEHSWGTVTPDEARCEQRTEQN